MWHREGKVLLRRNCVPQLYRVIQEERSIFLEVMMSVIVRKKIHMNMCIIPNDYRDTATKISSSNTVRFLFVGLHGERNLHKVGGYMRRNARSRFGCCCPHKETRRSTQTNRGAKSIEVEGGIF
jgi:hypothetical protein